MGAEWPDNVAQSGQDFQFNLNRRWTQGGDGDRDDDEADDNYDDDDDNDDDDDDDDVAYFLRTTISKDDNNNNCGALCLRQIKRASCVACPALLCAGEGDRGIRDGRGLA